MMESPLAVDDVILRIITHLHWYGQRSSLDVIEELILGLKRYLCFIPEIRLLTMLSDDPQIRSRHLLIDATTLRVSGLAFWRGDCLIVSREGIARMRKTREPVAMVEAIDSYLERHLRRHGEDDTS